MTAIILLGHGSPDPRSAAGLRSLARAVSRRAAGRDVRVAFLDHDEPGLTSVARELAEEGADVARVVPAFLTSAYHVRSDVPRAIARAQEHADLSLEVTAPIGPDPALIDLLEARTPAGAPVVLAVAGTRDPDAQRELEHVAETWSRRRGAPVVVGHAAMGTPDVPTAIAGLAGQTGVSPVVAAYVLFPGVLADRIAAAAQGLRMSGPFGDDASAAVLRRIDEDAHARTC